MKTKIVVKVCMNDEKSRRKALKLSVGISGVESVALKGPDMNQVEVMGEGIDAVALTRQLRKNVAHTELVSLGEVKKVEAPAAVVTPTPPVVWGHVPQYWNDRYVVREVMISPSQDPSCTIM
ncbi:hypothetical protein CASFOL_017689 [Castilleja foliolosa]|uniref:Uncharacterized protein n=1 Tax=Castilleja foliolosa TaxID=1961234 RepID=A0ABD3D7X7_9LAMI